MNEGNLYQAFICFLCNIVDAYTAVLYVVDPKSRQLHLVAHHSLSKNFNNALLVEPQQGGLLSQVSKLGQIIDLDKPPEDMAAKVPFYKPGESYIKGVFAVPVGEGTGVLYVDTKKSWGFNEKEQKWIREAAALFHRVLQRDSSADQRESYARILELWYHLDQAAFGEFSLDHFLRLVVDRCSQFLEVDYGFMTSCKKGESRYRIVAATSDLPPTLARKSFQLQQGLVGWVLTNGKPLFIPRLNPDIPEHFLFLPGDPLPRKGAFWGLPIPTSSTHSFALAFLGKEPIQWSPDDYYAISHILHFLHFILEHHYWREECERLQTYDLATGLYNAMAFEASVEDVLTASMEDSTPFTLALLQFEPWQLLYIHYSPYEVRQWQHLLAMKLGKSLPPDALLGQMTENRFGVLLPATTPREADNCLAPLRSLGKQVSTRHIKAISLQGYLGRASFPQEGVRSEELWPLVYQRLYEAFES